MASPRPELAQLEQWVAQGRLADALDGYQKLLAAKPGDALLRARVQMIKEAQAQPRQEPPGEVEAPKGSFMVKPEDIADSYVLAGRLDDALLLLDRMLVQRPGDRALLDRMARIQRLKSGNTFDDGEATAPHGVTAPPPSAAPSTRIHARPVAPQAPTTSMARPVTEVVVARSGAMSLSSRLPVIPPPKAPEVDTNPSRPVVTDDAADRNYERTLRSAPPTRRPVKKAPVVEATVISAPPKHMPRVEIERTVMGPAPTHPSSDEPSGPSTQTGLTAQVEESEDHGATIMAPGPTAAQLAAMDDVPFPVSPPEHTVIGGGNVRGTSGRALQQSISDRTVVQGPVRKR